MPRRNYGASKKLRSAAWPGPSLMPGRDLPLFAFIILGFALVVLVGFLLLLLPFSSVQGSFTRPVDALFTATSATTDTGLMVVETATHWSRFGQGVILTLIQLGGLGFMLFSSFVILLARRRVSLYDFRFRDALGVSNFRSFFVLFLQSLVLTIVVEGLGAYLLWRRFQETSPDRPLWPSIFYSVSAFNNAGFDLSSSLSLTGYTGDVYFLMTIAGLAIVGGLSVPVIFELLRKFSLRRLVLDSKLALLTTFFLLLMGTIVIFALEGGNSGTLGALDSEQKVSNAFFTSATSRSVGFTSLAIGGMKLQTLVLLMFLMFIGGVSGSTAGGIKINTFSVFFLTALSYIRGRTRVTAFQRRIPEVEIHRAVSVFFLASAFILMVALILTATEKASFLNLSFETISAFGTVGFSTGITSSLTTAGKLILCLTMFVGRLGPLIAIMALVRPLLEAEEEYPEEEVRIG